ncbi:hypothetical protein QBC35DRAFT_506001 [Podospora australis]|uniref:Copper acquisition factor BIM1-like domain-containing protein n=1 Tax=Podospora australis TaxID=1536484 RepID=A0AAN6WM78_9PEZI|nr:hypothetical protein QBC35DRAFT_506001 [Podospora australis]
MISTKLLVSAVLAHSVSAHVVLTYPLWRGNNLILNETHPWGMQWEYPCGGMNPTTNRSYWPLDGGAVALQPGWFKGHETALMYINLGLGETPTNYSFPLSFFHIRGPTNDPYPGSVCMPLVKIPEGIRGQIKSGDRASIQIVEAAKHGAGQFTCADIIFTDDLSLVPEVNATNCFNSTDIAVSAVTLPGEGNPTTGRIAGTDEPGGLESGLSTAPSASSSVLPSAGERLRGPGPGMALNMLTWAVGGYLVRPMW